MLACRQIQSRETTGTLECEFIAIAVYGPRRRGSPWVSWKGAYPISGLTYVLIPRDNRSVGEQRAFRDFINYALSAGQDAAEELSYTKLPAPVQQKSRKAKRC